MANIPKKQGHLDGLCGVYAVVNALTELGQKSPEFLFTTACKSFAASRWPETLWDGTTLRDLEVMIKACMAEMDDSSIRVTYPFRSNQPSSDADFWVAFEELFAENRKKKCAIIGLEEPWLHWLVVKSRPNSLLFIDSDGLQSRSSVSRENIYAGPRRSNNQQYRLNRKEVIIFEKTT